MKALPKPVNLAVVIALMAGACYPVAFAQQPDAPRSAAALVSEPGKANVVQAVEVSATIVAIDRQSRKITLKGPKGDAVEFVAGDEVRNFDQLKVGDVVVARYIESLTLEVKKSVVAHGGAVVQEKVVGAQPGAQPAGAAVRQVTAIVDVTAVDPAKGTIRIKGPTGNVRTLKVQNPDQFKVVKVGDHIEVTYTEAVAVTVEPAAAKK
jgi:hypothetical protein